jgi:hypothetical protein
MLSLLRKVISIQLDVVSSADQCVAESIDHEDPGTTAGRSGALLARPTAYAA